MGIPSYRGQGATKYLVALVVVLIIVLVSVSLIGFFPGTAKDSAAAESNIYWQGQARPIQVVEATLAGDSVFNFVLKNAEPDPVTLTQIRINHASSPFTESGAASSNSIYFGAGETKSVSVVSTTFNCVEGRTGTLELSIGYNTQYGTAMTESSDKAFVMKCNMDSDGGATPYTCSGTTQGSCPEGERCCAICTNECPIYVYCSSFHACPTCGLPVCD